MGNGFYDRSEKPKDFKPERSHANRQNWLNWLQGSNSSIRGPGSDGPHSHQHRNSYRRYDSQPNMQEHLHLGETLRGKANSNWRRLNSQNDQTFMHKLRTLNNEYPRLHLNGARQIHPVLDHTKKRKNSGPKEPSLRPLAPELKPPASDLKKQDPTLDLASFLPLNSSHGVTSKELSKTAKSSTVDERKLAVSTHNDTHLEAQRLDGMLLKNSSAELVPTKTARTAESLLIGSYSETSYVATQKELLSLRTAKNDPEYPVFHEDTAKELYTFTLSAAGPSSGDKNDENKELSDAETVISDTVPSSKARALYRRKSHDSKRIELKRRAIFSLEDEDDLSDRGNRPSHTQGRRKKSLARPGSKKMALLKDKAPQSVKSYKTKCDSTGRSQLQRACKRGDVEEVRSLIVQGADPNECDFGGFTCLHEAALAGHTAIVEILIQEGASVNKQALEAGDLETPLMDACENKHLETVKLLLKYGADPHICNVDGLSAITKLQQLCEEDDSFKPVLKLLEKNTDVQENESHVRTMFDDPTDSYFGDLMKKKANNVYRSAAQGHKEATAENFITHALDLLKMPDILFLAARNGHLELVDILLGLNPTPFEINQTNKIGVTVLHATVGRGFSHVVKFLLSKGADPTLRRGIDGKNALKIAENSAQYDAKEVYMIKMKIEDPLANLDELLEGSAADSVSQTKKEDTKQSTVKHDSAHASKPGRAQMKHAEVKSEHTNGKQERKSVKGSDNDNDNDGGYVAKDSAKEHEEGNKRNEREENGLGNESSSENEHHAVREKGKESSCTPEIPGLSANKQKEMRLKAAEEAKVWQEKMMAKKRARKEMFLQAEKEKEKRRKEEEERRAQEMEAEAARIKVELLKEAQAAERQAKIVQQKQAVIERLLVLLRYPIGLREALAPGASNERKYFKFAPLYVFSIGGDEWVTDLQVSLLVSRSVSEIHGEISDILQEEATVESKDRLWSLFFHMIGIAKNGLVERKGREKFRDLCIRYIKALAAREYVKKHNPEIFLFVWEQGHVARVKFSTIDSLKAVPKSLVRGITDELDLGFVPPKLKKRQDVIQTIDTASNSLW